MPDPLRPKTTPAALPTADQIIDLLSDDFSRAGVDIEAVTIQDHATPVRVTVVVDSSDPLNLDAVAMLSRTASALLDENDSSATEYELEVTTPGVERPLTTARHFQRAHGRLAAFILVDGEELTARIGRLTGDVLQVVLRKPVKGTGWLLRDIAFGDIDKAVVQVEFSAPNRQELELAGITELGGDA